MPTGLGHKTANYQRLSRDHRTDCARRGRPCWLCGQPIDYTLPWSDPQAYATDHVLPVSTHPELAERITNFQPAHKRCNEARGNSAPPSDLGTPSRPW